jgi:predicted outer membrane repeat protein
VFIQEAGLELTNVTVSGNSAGTSGGGVESRSGPTPNVVEARHTTVLGNTAPSGSGIMFLDSGLGGHTTLTGSIVAGNPGGGADCSGDTAVTDGGGNFGGDGSCGAGFAPIVPGLDISSTLADNGGPTRTHALLAGGVAIDAAGACGLATDQRGVPRSDGACDSGSYEFRDPLLVTMASMSARAGSRGVVVEWTTALEADTVGFRVYRQTDDRAKSSIAVGPFIHARGNGYSGASYELLDPGAKGRGGVRYFIEDIDLFGRVTRHGPIDVVPSSVRRAGGSR